MQIQKMTWWSLSQTNLGKGDQSASSGMLTAEHCFPSTSTFSPVSHQGALWTQMKPWTPEDQRGENFQQEYLFDVHIPPVLPLNLNKKKKNI